MGVYSLKVEGDRPEPFRDAVALAFRLSERDGKKERLVNAWRVEEGSLVFMNIPECKVLSDGVNRLPAHFDAETAADMALSWLKGASDYRAAKKPYAGGDGSHKEGWRVEAGDLSFRDVVLISPHWTYYGK